MWVLTVHMTTLQGAGYVHARKSLGFAMCVRCLPAVVTCHYVVKTRICPIGILRFEGFCAILLGAFRERARLRVLSNTLEIV